MIILVSVGFWGYGKGESPVLQVGDRIVYGIHGVCCIVDVEKRVVDRKKVEYFVLEPVQQPVARFYVPTHNPVALSKLRPLLTPGELEQLLSADHTQTNCWIADENLRKQKYRELISSGDRAALFAMIHALQNHKDQQLAAGRKFHLCDENFLRDAKKVINSEFSYILGIAPEDVAAYIESKLNK